MDEYGAALQDLVSAAQEIGYPKEFGLALAQYVRGPKTMLRMAEYLRRCRPHSFEEAADEAVTLVSERSRWIEEERSEEAQAAFTAFMNRPRAEDEVVDWTDDSWHEVTETEFFGDPEEMDAFAQGEDDGAAEDAGPYNCDFDDSIPW